MFSELYIYLEFKIILVKRFSDQTDFVSNLVKPARELILCEICCS